MTKSRSGGTVVKPVLVMFLAPVRAPTVRSCPSSQERSR